MKLERNCGLRDSCAERPLRSTAQFSAATDRTTDSRAGAATVRRFFQQECFFSLAALMTGVNWRQEIPVLGRSGQADCTPHSSNQASDNQHYKSPDVSPVPRGRLAGQEERGG